MSLTGSKGCARVMLRLLLPITNVVQYTQIKKNARDSCAVNLQKPKSQKQILILLSVLFYRQSIE